MHIYIYAIYIFVPCVKTCQVYIASSFAVHLDLHAHVMGFLMHSVTQIHGSVMGNDRPLLAAAALKFPPVGVKTGWFCRLGFTG